ncbi:ribbon-helix-helix protein, CopG family [Leptospira ryugenii]|uniref:Ribbon-helix-helix protein, CopG family n=1 Tax=Leptospira ryugenii TaxID=1917863 RepID=A0A2P2DYQ7_9LEPT|nr:CopG family transcriptional regulator [Leptospira ryugenii]GBF49768.1 ribbon-helix-helix protein, CopG family [Leptospira ryugenii]
MAKIDKRFQILFSEEEIQLLKKESDRRGISQAELLRLALRNEVTKKSDLTKWKALKALAEVLD